MSKCKGFLPAIAIALLLSPSPTTSADPESSRPSRLLEDRFNLSVGWYTPGFSTDAAIGVAGIVGTLIRLEDDVGLDEEKSSGRLDGFYRFNEKHAIDFSYLVLDRNGGSILDKRIEFNGVIFNVGARTRSTFDSELLRISYRYSFFRNDKIDTGVTAGLSTYSWDFSIEGDATVDDGMGGTMVQFAKANKHLVTPIPTVGIFLSHALRHNVIFRFIGQFLDVRIGDIEGRLTDAKGTVDWFFSKHVGVGVGLATTGISVRQTGTDPFRVDYRYGGAMVYFGFAF